MAISPAVRSVPHNSDPRSTRRIARILSALSRYLGHLNLQVVAVGNAVDPAVHDPHYSIRHAQHLVVMSSRYDRYPRLFVHLFEQFDDLGAGAQIQVARGSIRQHHRWIVGQGSGYRYALVVEGKSALGLSGRCPSSGAIECLGLHPNEHDASVFCPGRFVFARGHGTFTAKTGGRQLRRINAGFNQKIPGAVRPSLTQADVESVRAARVAVSFDERFELEVGLESCRELVESSFLIFANAVLVIVEKDRDEFPGFSGPGYGPGLAQPFPDLHPPLYPPFGLGSGLLGMGAGTSTGVQTRGGDTAEETDPNGSR